MATVLLVVAAIFLALFGAVNLTPATIGVGVICLACLLGILARIAQASEQHSKSQTADKSQVQKPDPLVAPTA